MIKNKNKKKKEKKKKKRKRKKKKKHQKKYSDDHINRIIYGHHGFMI